MENYLLLSVIFFFVAAIYSSVGFGGGSSYIAILVLAGMDLYFLRSAALMCNIVVVAGGTIIFYKKGYLNMQTTLPIVIASVPLAFLGGFLPVRSEFIFIVLGVTLLIASFLLFLKRAYKRGETTASIRKNRKSSSIIGGLIGFISGMVGIGGGIFLAPVLNFFNWDSPKKIAAIASFFILVNSVAGLVGQWVQNSPTRELLPVWVLLLAVFLGGQVGSRLAIQQLSSVTIRRTTAVLIFFASIKILNDHLFSKYLF